MGDISEFLGITENALRKIRRILKIPDPKEVQRERREEHATRYRLPPYESVEVMHPVFAEISLNPEKAKKKILAAFRKEQCHYARAAKTLECGFTTFNRWIELLGIKKEILAMVDEAKRDGWHHGVLGGAGFHRARRKSA